MTKKHHPCVAYFNKEDERAIRELQEDLSNVTGSKSSLIEWRPHITVGKALELNESDLRDLEKELISFSSAQTALDVELKGFGFMVNEIVAELYNCEPYVVYLNVIVNPKLLSFVKKLDVILRKYEFKHDIFPYNPHLTLAFKDLNREGYDKAKKYLADRTFSKAIEMTSFSLAHDKKGDGRFEEAIKFNLGLA